MAFHLPLELPDTGATAAYWRITHVQMDRAAGVVEALLHGYRDKSAREAGLAPLHRFAFRFDLAAMEDPARLVLADLYRAIRAEPPGTDEDGQPLPPVFGAAADA